MRLIDADKLNFSEYEGLSCVSEGDVDRAPTVDAVLIDRVLEIIDDADKKAGDKTYIVLDDGSFYSQTKYIKEKMLELNGGEQE